MAREQHGQAARGRRIVEVSKEEYARFKQTTYSDNFLAVWGMAVILGAVDLGIYAGMVTGSAAMGVPLKSSATFSWPQLAALCFASVSLILCMILAFVAVRKDEKNKARGLEEWKKRHDIPSDENVSVRLAPTSPVWIKKPDARWLP